MVMTHWDGYPTPKNGIRDKLFKTYQKISHTKLYKKKSILSSTLSLKLL